jgi:tetratricopeptide (TPR) repeat protein
MLAALKKLLKEGFSAKDIERLRASAASAEDKKHLASEIDAFLHRAAVTLLPPQRAALWFQIGEAYREGEAAEDALRSYRLAVTEDPTHVASARAWIALAESANLPEEIIDALHARIHQLRKSGHEEQRIELHRRAAHILRDDMHDDGRAFLELLRAAKLAPRDGTLWAEVTVLADRAQMHRELASVLEDLAGKQADPDEERNFLLRVHELAAGALGDPAWARRIAAHLAELPKGDGEGQKSAAELTRALVDIDELRATEARLRRERRFPDLLLALAQHELALTEEAREERSDIVLTQAIIIAHELGEAERAYSTAERAIADDPKSVGAHRFIIDLAIAEAWFERAVGACERFAEACMGQALEALLLACELALDRLGDEGRAQRAFEVARALDPTHPGVEAFSKKF